jgi:hypothetical protein
MYIFLFVFATFSQSFSDSQFVFFCFTAYNLSFRGKTKLFGMLFNIFR